MIEIFDEFYFLLCERCDKTALLFLGEDAIRYDFFYALITTKNLRPSDIQLEYPINQQSFIARKNINSYRKEKPQLDLVVDTEQLSFCAEFGLFRQNSNEKGNINSTARTVKFLNDMIRLGIDSFYTKRKSYFICVADKTFLGHQLKTKLIGAFPSDYQITYSIIKEQLKTKTSAFDNRFLPIFESLNSTVHSHLVFDKQVKGSKINRETRVLIWETNLLTN